MADKVGTYAVLCVVLSVVLHVVLYVVLCLVLDVVLHVALYVVSATGPCARGECLVGLLLCTVFGGFVG